jgi:hypothetical protein
MQWSSAPDIEVPYETVDNRNEACMAEILILHRLDCYRVTL